VKRSKNRSDVTRFWGSGDSTSKRILDVLERCVKICKLTNYSLMGVVTVSRLVLILELQS